MLPELSALVARANGVKPRLEVRYRRTYKGAQIESTSVVRG